MLMCHPQISSLPERKGRWVGGGGGVWIAMKGERESLALESSLLRSYHEKNIDNSYNLLSTYKKNTINIITTISILCLLCLLHLQVSSLPLVPLGKPYISANINQY